MKRTIASNQQRHVVDVMSVLFIFIVLYLHHYDHTTSYLDINYHIYSWLVYISIGGFLFLSAYKLTKSKLHENFTIFWVKRLIRIYPLYFLALLVYEFVLFDSFNAGRFVLHIFNLHMIFPASFGGQMSILYYVGFLLMFYLIFSLFKNMIQNVRKFLAVSAVIYILLFFSHILTQDSIVLLHRNFLLYYPIFISGMLYSYYETKIRSHRILNPFILFYIFIFTTPIFFLIQQIRLTLPLWSDILLNTMIVYVATIPIFLLLISRKLKVIMKIKWLKYIAFSTYGMYLFHRPIWITMVKLYDTPSIYQWLYIVVLGTAIIIFVSYYIQLGYNLVIRKIVNTQ